MKNRSRIDIMTALLHSAIGGKTKSGLVYKTFIGHNQLKEYLALLKEGGLLTYDQSSMTYRTTARGTEFLAINDKLNELSGLAVVTDIEVGKRNRRSPALPERQKFGYSPGL